MKHQSVRIRRACFLLCGIMMFVSVFWGCSSGSSGTGTSTLPKSGKSGISADVQWLDVTFPEVVLTSTTAFVGTFTGYEWIDQTQCVKAFFHVDEDLYGNIPEEDVVCIMLGEAEGVYPSMKRTGYRIGDQYLMLTGASKRLFYPTIEYFQVSNTYLYVTGNAYRLLGQNLPFDSKESICQEIKDIWKKSRKTPAGVAYENDGSWETADFIAEVRLVSVVNPSSPIFSGTCYWAEVVRMIRGKESKLFKPYRGMISLTLSAADTEVGQTVVAGFTAKDGAETVYTQEGLMTLLSPEEYEKQQGKGK